MPSPAREKDGRLISAPLANSPGVRKNPIHNKFHLDRAECSPGTRSKENVVLSIAIRVAIARPRQSIANFMETGAVKGELIWSGKDVSNSGGVARASCNWPSKYTRTMNPPYSRPSAEGDWVFGRT